MDAIDPMTMPPSAAVPLRRYRLPDAATGRDTAVVRVRDFATLMKIIAAHDLWDALEAQMIAQGCTSFRIGAQPMRIASAVLQHQIEQGELPAAPALFAACGSIGGSDEGKAADAGGLAGGIKGTGAAEAAESAKGSEPITPGQSRGSQDKPQ